MKIRGETFFEKRFPHTPSKKLYTEKDKVLFFFYYQWL